MESVRAEVDFDHKSLSWLADRHAHNAELRQQCPVIWNQRYGGFWFVTGYDEVAAVARDSETFTTRFEDDGSDGLTYVGIVGVPGPKGYLPSASARPKATAMRRSGGPLTPSCCHPPLPETCRSWSRPPRGSWTKRSVRVGWTWCWTSPTRCPGCGR